MKIKFIIILTLLLTGYLLANNNNLVKAVFYDDIKSIKQLIKKNVSPNAKDINGCRPLHMAAKQGNLRATKILLNIGAYVNALDSNNNTALHIASEFGHISIVRLLLSKKANVNIKNKKQKTPFWYAVYNGHNKIAKILLKNGATSDFKDRFGWSVFHLAAFRGYPKVIKLLLEFNVKGADYKDYFGSIPLEYALLSQNLEAIRLLAQSSEQKFNSILLKLIDLENIFALKLLIKAKTDINLKLCLILAIRENKINLAKFIINERADINFRDINGVTPLQWAANRSSQITDILLKSGAEVNTVDNYNVTPLEEAYRSINLNAVKDLLKAGINLDSYKDYINNEYKEANELLELADKLNGNSISFDEFVNMPQKLRIFLANRICSMFAKRNFISKYEKKLLGALSDTEKLKVIDYILNKNYKIFDWKLSKINNIKYILFKHKYVDIINKLNALPGDKQELEKIITSYNYGNYQLQELIKKRAAIALILSGVYINNLEIKLPLEIANLISSYLSYAIFI